MLRQIAAFFLLAVITLPALAQTLDVPNVEADVWVGFAKDEDKIASHEFINNGREVLVIGSTLLRLFEVETGKELYSVQHDIQRFAKAGIFNFSWTQWLPYIVEPEGKWLASAERVGARKIRSLVVRNISDAKTIAVMEFPDVAMDFIHYDEQKKEILTFGSTGKKTMIAKWSASDFKMISSVAVDDHKWHRYIHDGKKILIGSGDTRFSLAFFKQGDTLALFDPERYEVEKNFSAPDLRPRTAFTDTIVSDDEKYLISRRDDRYFVWEIDGDGSPKYEFKNLTPGTNLHYVDLIANRYAVFQNGKDLAVFDLNKGDKPILEIRSDNVKDSAKLRGFSDDGETLLIDDDTSVWLVRTNGDGKPVFKITRDSPHERFYPVTYSKDLKLFAVGRNNRKEKKEFRTELYDADGKLKDTIGASISKNTKMSPDGNFLYYEGIGYTSLWNIRERKSTGISLRTEQSTTSDSTNIFMTDYGPYNIEHTAISPNFDKILKYGDDITTLYDAYTGDEISLFLLKANAKYTKAGKLKKSGLGNAGWVGDGSRAFAISSKRNMIGFWKVTK